MSNIRNFHAHDMMNEKIQHFEVTFDYKAEKHFSIEMNKLKTNNLRKQITTTILGNSGESKVQALLKTFE